ncbi:MAG: hypothetical protein CMO01_15705 [Thalassobius sp.]|nr:hypothetical protein [Thalassovita sp.]
MPREILNYAIGQDKKNNIDDIFISYSRRDLSFASSLVTQLKNENIKVWFDQNDIPEAVNFRLEIERGIINAHNFIFIISPDSIVSPYCREEIEKAIYYGKRIIPVLYRMPDQESVQMDMHPAIQDLNWIYLKSGENGIFKLCDSIVNAIEKHKDYVSLHTKLLNKALDWVSNKRKNDYLLVGQDRLDAEDWLKINFENEHSPCEPSDIHTEYICESEKNAFNLMTEVFICYSTEDKDRLDTFRKVLMRNSFTVWTNRTDIRSGKKFEEEIIRGIEGATNFIFLISPHSVKSEYCLKELDYAYQLNKRIISIVVEDTPSESIPSFIHSLQFMDFSESFTNKDVFNQRCDELLHELYTDAEYVERHKQLLVKALKWQKQNANMSILLRGKNLELAKAWLKESESRKNYSPINVHRDFIVESELRSFSLPVEVFISYSRSDSDFARKLNEYLQLNGKTTWFDQEYISAGTDFKEEIFKGIKEADNLLFIITPHSIRSPYCAEEVEYAVRLNKRIITVFYNYVSDQELPNDLANIQWIEFRPGIRDFHTSFSELLRTLDIDREHVQFHTKLSKKSLEWEAANKNHELLLGESELAIADQWVTDCKNEGKEPAPTQLQLQFIEDSREALESARNKEKNRQKILTGLISGALLITIIFSIFITRAYKNITESNLARYEVVMKIMGQLKAQQVEQHFSQMEANLNFLKYSPIIVDDLSRMTYWSNDHAYNLTYNPHYQGKRMDYNHIIQPIRSSNHYEDIILSDRNGRVIYNTNQNSNFQINEAKLNFTFSSKPENKDTINYITDNSKMTVVTPIYDSLQQWIGNALIIINVSDYLKELLQDNSKILGENGEIIICSKSGSDVSLLTPINYSEIKEIPYIIPPERGGFDAIKRAAYMNTGSEIITDYRGKSTLNYFTSIPKMKWGIVIKTDIEDIEKEQSVF